MRWLDTELRRKVFSAEVPIDFGPASFSGKAGRGSGWVSASSLAILPTAREACSCHRRRQNIAVHCRYFGDVPGILRVWDAVHRDKIRYGLDADTARLIPQPRQRIAEDPQESTSGLTPRMEAAR